MIQEINVIAHPSQSVEGYQNVPLDQLGGITNGFVRSIICNCLDYLPFEQRQVLFSELINKICIDGTLTLRFLNASLLPNKITSGDITGEKLSEIISNISSCWSENEFQRVVQQLNNCSISKLFYEQVYTVVSIQKTK
jgi:hypothetical protein